MPHTVSESLRKLCHDDNPLGMYWDELPGSMKKDFNGHPSITAQLGGYGAPRPTPESNEDPLIEGRMRMFPNQHPSLGSVRNTGIGLGCPAIIFDQMSSDQWKTTTRAQIDERQPTFKKGREGKKQVPDISAQAGLLVPPREVLVISAKEKDTYARDLMISKHMSNLTKVGRW